MFVLLTEVRMKVQSKRVGKHRPENTLCSTPTKTVKELQYLNREKKRMSGWQDRKYLKEEIMRRFVAGFLAVMCLFAIIGCRSEKELNSSEVSSKKYQASTAEAKTIVDWFLFYLEGIDEDNYSVQKMSESELSDGTLSRGVMAHNTELDSWLHFSVFYDSDGTVDFVMLTCDKKSTTEPDEEFALLSYGAFCSMEIGDMEPTEFWENLNLYSTIPGGNFEFEGWTINVDEGKDTLILMIT